MGAFNKPSFSKAIVRKSGGPAARVAFAAAWAASSLPPRRKRSISLEAARRMELESTACTAKATLPTLLVVGCLLLPEVVG